MFSSLILTNCPLFSLNLYTNSELVHIGAPSMQDRLVELPVTVLFKKPLASRFLALPGTIPPFHCSIHEAINGGMASGGCSCYQYAGNLQRYSQSRQLLSYWPFPKCQWGTTVQNDLQTPFCVWWQAIQRLCE